MNIKLEDIIYAVIPNCKNDFKEARKCFEKYLDDLEDCLDYFKDCISKTLSDLTNPKGVEGSRESKDFVRTFDTSELVFAEDENIITWLLGEKRERGVKADTTNKKSSFCWATVLTAFIAEKDDNRLEFTSICKICFDILGLYSDFSFRDSQILKLYPNDMDYEHIQWNNFLSGHYENKFAPSFYLILCIIIYIAIDSRKKPIEERTRIGTKCHLLITRFIDKTEVSENEKKTKEFYLRDYLDVKGIDFSNIKTPTNYLFTTFTRNIDDALGSFPMPQYYQERTALIKNLIETGFKDSNTLFLTGDRGIGKSLFAKSYALRCAKGDNVRTECRYEHIIWTTYDAAGIYATISSLACTENVAGDLFENKIEMMKGLAKGGETSCLLVIDNFDFDENEALISELSSDAFAELNKTGWHILFTTKNNMKNINLSVVRQEEILPLSVGELCILFRNLLIANEEFETGKLELLINTYLRKNTYLVSLSAGLCDMLLDRKCETLNDALDYIIQAFEGLKVSQLDEKNLAEKDAKVLTFMEHYKTMFALSDIQSNKDKMTLLYNLALVPLSGVKRIAFFKDAFINEDERKKMQTICDELVSNRWINYQKENNIISLHPMIREIIKDSDVQLNSVARYIRVSNERMHSVSFSDMFKSIESLKAIYQIIDNKDWRNEPKGILLEYCQLVGMISAYYDILHGFPKEAYEFGCRAVELLDQYVSLQKELCNDEKVILAELYNDCGYAILHYIRLQKKQGHHNEAKKTFEIAYESIKKAEKIVGKSNASLLNEETDFKLALVQTYIQGNLAACFYTNNEHEKVVSIHLNELEYRKKLSAIAKDDENMQKKLRIAIGNSHKGIASGLFYIGTGKDNNYMDGFEELYKSYYHHQEASKLYNTEKTNHNMLIAMVRMLGTVIELMQKHFRAFSEKENINLLIENGLKNCMSAAQFYSELKFGVPTECRDWIGKTIRLWEVASQNDLMNYSIVESIKQAYECYQNNENMKKLVNETAVKLTNGKIVKLEDVVFALEAGKEKKSR